MQDVRPSQVIYRHGPGSIVNLPDRDSRIVMGLEWWPEKSIRVVREERLERELGVDFIGEPKKGWDTYSRQELGVPSREFPITRYCSECGRLYRIYERKCPSCGNKDRPIPPRLVLACERGHLDEFPWQWWLKKCHCKSPELHLVGQRESGSMSDLRIECKSCNEKKDFSGALNTDYFERLSCNGRRPWLGDREECNASVKGVMRTATNVHFPIIRSALSVPPYSDTFAKDLYKDNLLSRFREHWSNRDYISSIVEHDRAVKRLMRKHSLSKEQFIEKVRKLIEEGERKRGIKELEWLRFTEGADHNPVGDFVLDPLELSELKDYFTSIKMVPRLREVVVLTGFTRIKPFTEDTPDENVQGLSMDDPKRFDEIVRKSQHITPLPNPDREQKKWTLGTEMYGEGIFFEFNEDALRKWKERIDVAKRVKAITSQSDLPKEREAFDMRLGESILVHTFAHMMIRQITSACGYPTASLKERIYSSDDPSMAGVLVYTSSSDSGGTLGGLVAQAEKESLLIDHIRDMIESTEVCSQDPLCGEHDPEATHNPWGASCHACSQVSETSCEGLQNKLLDRYLIFNEKEPSLGYFNELFG